MSATTAGMVMMDEWQKGTLFYKKALWTYYSLVNLAGAIVSITAIVLTARKRTRHHPSAPRLLLPTPISTRPPTGKELTAADVFNFHLIAADALMSLFCGIQCFYDLVMNSEMFQGGASACYVEATMRIVHMLDIAFAVALIAGNLLLVFRFRIGISWQAATILSSVCYLGITTVGLVLSKYSTAELQPAGLYCLPRLQDAPLVGYFFLPAFLAALMCAMGCFSALFHFLRPHRQRIHPPPGSNNQFYRLPVSTAMLSYGLFWIFLFGLGPALFVLVHVRYGRGLMTESLDTLLGVPAAVHPLLQALYYLFVVERQQQHHQQPVSCPPSVVAQTSPSTSPLRVPTLNLQIQATATDKAPAPHGLTMLVLESPKGTPRVLQTITPTAEVLSAWPPPTQVFVFATDSGGYLNASSSSPSASSSGRAPPPPNNSVANNSELPSQRSRTPSPTRKQRFTPPPLSMRTIARTFDQRPVRSRPPSS